jgi:branched-chain amino acid aminotransferase
MHSLVAIDGQIVPAERAQISVFDRGFLYGDSVFETLRTYGGVPFALTDHLSRLAQSAERVLIPLPVSLEQLGQEILDAVRAAQHPESYVRVMVTRGQGDSLGLDPELAHRPVRIVIVMPLVAPPARYYEDGISTVSYRTERIADATEAAGAKLGNYLMAVLAMRTARQAGADEALILDRAGNVLEGTTSNVFAVSGGKLVTAPEDAAILVGITRARVLGIARELGLAVEERPLPLAELCASDEAFITSSIREIVPVVRVDGHPIGSGRPGPATLRLLQHFREKVTSFA